MLRPPAMIATDAVINLGLPKLPVKAVTRRLSTLASVLLAVSGIGLAQADAYTDLDAVGKAYVTRLCMPIQHMKDTASFRECVIQHSNAIAASSSTTDLNVDERIAKLRACGEAGNVNSDCSPNAADTVQLAATSTEDSVLNTSSSRLNTNQEAVLGAPAAALPNNTNAATTFTDNLTDTVEQSVVNTLEAVTGDDAADIAVQAVAVPVAPSVPRTPTTASVEQAVVAAVDDTRQTAQETAQASPEPDNTTQANIVLAQNTSPASTAPTSSDSKATEESASDINNEDFEEAEAPLDVAKRLWSQLLSSMEGVSGIHRIILLSAAALPLLLIGFWLLMRRRKKEPEYIPPSHAGSLRDRVRAYPDDELDDTLDTAADHSIESQQLYEEQAKELFADEIDPVLSDDIDDTVAMPASITPAAAMARNDKFDFETETETETGTARKADTTVEENMRSWLDSLEHDKQLSIAIEFMIYWMAYTDERYQPELKQSVLAMEDPDEHDLVKRRVLTHDTAAFAQTTSWLQDNTSTEQRVQIIKLLMALLVSEGALTPVQNTMLRFLTNAFGMSHEKLDEWFQTAFAEPLPPMPRPDKPSWWEQQPEDKRKRWDARSVAQQSQTIQSRVKLGLPLSGSLDADELEEKYERAISRCRPDLFDLLGEREQLLAEQQQQKFDTAFETLKEISI
ncbi:MAG: hypothetical protein AB8B84_06725 [Granulosicoccus sp.]